MSLVYYIFWHSVFCSLRRTSKQTGIKHNARLAWQRRGGHKVRFINHVPVRCILCKRRPLAPSIHSISKLKAPMEKWTKSTFYRATVNEVCVQWKNGLRSPRATCCPMIWHNVEVTLEKLQKGSLSRPGVHDFEREVIQWRMDAESGDDVKDGLTSERGESRQTSWWGWWNESGIWFQLCDDVYLN